MHTMLINGIKQFNVCCHGNNFNTAAKLFTSFVSLTASIKQLFA